MKTITVKDKHLKLDQKKIDIAKRILGTKTETATIDMALNLLIQNNIARKKKKELVNRILSRRAKLKTIPEDVTDWVQEGRRERDNLYDSY